MKNIKDILTEKLIINKDTSVQQSNEIEKEFQNKESIETLKFILDIIKTSKEGTFSSSIFAYWDMYINKNILTCMHIGWSRSSIGHGKSKYIQTCINNYNKTHGTDIKVQICGWSGDGGVSILKIREVVNALKEKFSGVNIKDDDSYYAYL